MEHEQLLTPSEVAGVLKISMRTLLRIRKSGALRETRAGQSVRFTWDQDQRVHVPVNSDSRRRAKRLHLLVQDVFFKA